MKRQIFTVFIFLFALNGIFAQSIYNSGARIVSQTGTFWVIDNGNFTLKSESATNLATMANLKIQNDMKDNLNVGTSIDGTSEQTNNSTIEKYCYNNIEANCDIY